MKSIINKNFISIDIIITLMGIFGLAFNIIVLFFSTLIPCGKDDYYRNFCSSVKENGNNEGNTYYLDNFLTYIVISEMIYFQKIKMIIVYEDLKI